MSYFRASKKANVYQVQIGDKGQGLAPQATSFFIASGRGGWNHYRTRTFAPRRDFIFCMNRLGGVGAGRSQYKIRGLNHPDGARRCRPHRFGHRHRHSHEESYIGTLLKDVVEASGGKPADEEALLAKYPFLNDVIGGVAGMIADLLLFKPDDGEVSLHIEPLAALVKTGIPPDLLGGAPVGHILSDIAARLRDIGGCDGVVSLDDFKAVMVASDCPVYREAVKVMLDKAREKEDDKEFTFPKGKQFPDQGLLLGYFQPPGP